MAKQVDRLSAVSFEGLGPGKHADGDGLRLIVDKGKDGEDGARRWTLLIRTPGGKRRELGLGSAKGKRADQRDGLGLAEARVAARELRLKVKGGEPVTEAAPPAPTPTFGKCADDWYKANVSSWVPAHAHQVKQSLEVIAKPLRDLPVDQIDIDELLEVLEPLWSTTRETASRTRARIEAVLGYATVKKYHRGPNPAVWRGNLNQVLEKRRRAKKQLHHAALPYVLAPAFMAALRGITGGPARALEFTVLTAARAGEVLGSTWGEINPADALWTLPAERMKARVEHRVPLSPAAMAVLKTMANDAGFDGDDAVAKAVAGAPGGHIFKGPKTGGRPARSTLTVALARVKVKDADGKPVALVDAKRRPATTHGFRSCLCDWAAEATTFPRELGEMALAHEIGNAVAQAYQRSDLLEKRRPMMDDWAAFLGGV